MRAITAYEETNMYGGAHCTNIEQAKKAAAEGRDLMVHYSHYDGQSYHRGKYRVTNLRVDGDTVIGTTEDGEEWEATGTLCEYAKTGNREYVKNY